MTEHYPEDHRRFMPPALRAALGEPESDRTAQPAGEAERIEEGPSPQSDVVPSRAYRFFHAAAWKYAIGWISLIIVLVLFGMVCSPAYWRF